MNNLQSLIRYIKNDRLFDYTNILKQAKECNYQIISLRDYAQNNYLPNEKILILRHDVDKSSDATRRMLEIEKKYGANASYYFRNSTIDIELMKQIEDSGSEASLHFETIADFIKKNNISSRAELDQFDYYETCIQELASNLKELRKDLNFPFITIASHGEKVNLEFQIPNNTLTEDLQGYNRLGIILEAYNKEFIEAINCYISDTVIEINDGFRYGIHPGEAIKKEYPIILFLTHPEHWYYTGKARLRKIIKCLIKKNIQNQESFKRIVS